jgi:transcriptional regulator with XRE-family HTH domain
MRPELVEPLEPSERTTALKAARVRRSLTREQAAGRAGLTPEQAEWLEDGRLYRFPTGDDAVLAAMLYASALGIDRREARRMAGLPPRRGRLDFNPSGRAAIATCVLLLLATLTALLVVPRVGSGKQPAPAARAPAKKLPAPWQISVVALNGSGDINTTRQVANRIAALGYRIVKVARAGRFDYPQTVVYFAPGGEAIGQRLAGTLGVDAEPLPGGANPRRLVVIVGPSHF